MSNIAICERKNETAFEVFCLRCMRSIGTMNGDTLSSAIEANRQRGGVLCPECRKASCRYCGTMLTGNSKDGVCWFCELEKKIKTRTEEITAPLV